MIDVLIPLLAGILIGANFGFIIASFMRANDEEVLDK